VPQEGLRGLGNTYDVEVQAILLADYAHEFGFGEPTGIDIEGESSGIIPTPEWKRRVHSGPGFNPEDRIWYYADTCFMGIGQGDVTATPMQIARMTAAIANGGTLLTPHVAKAILDSDGNIVRTIEPQRELLTIEPEFLAAIREGMHQSVGFGGPGAAGVLAQQPGIDIAGKTGTAEFGGFDAETGKRQQHAWFTGFAPFDSPEVVVTVYFDLGVGGNKAAPVAGKIIRYYMENIAQ
jgi:penicillin-binding protein 2